jgi:hypothetical protein
MMTTEVAFTESRAAVTEALGQFRNAKEGAHLLSEAATRGVVMRQQTEKTQWAL